MTEVSIRDLRNRGGEVVDRAARGELITITRAGKRVAELRPLSPPGLSSEALVERWRHLPARRSWRAETRNRRGDRPGLVSTSEAHPRGVLDTSTVILLSRLRTRRCFQLSR
jgi:prevent-host-death family protein